MNFEEQKQEIIDQLLLHVDNQDQEFFKSIDKLRELTPPEPEVKELEWEQDGLNYKTINCSIVYSITFDSDTGYYDLTVQLQTDYETKIGTFEIPVEAKEDAENHFNELVKGCLK